MPFQHILVPIDFSDVSEHALAVAVELASSLQASIHILHVYEIPVYSFSFPDSSYIASPEAAAKLSELAQQNLDKVTSHYVEHGIPIQSMLRQGSPHEEIVSVATEIGADAIVLGTHGRGLLAHAILGSVTERVIRTSPVPVMTVRHKLTKPKRAKHA